ncbi:hypothetical protein D3C73_1463490 [compost metagenome]
MMAAGTQGRFRDIEHGDGGEDTGNRQPQQQRHVTGQAAGIGHRQHTGTDVGADDHRHGLDEGQALDLQAR